ncbi:hypothetical protein PghCCS26_18740 [Paenibacillus glycanilyticus]|uniref:Uncharacterized protein n=1 Tax=Paenibacillus glycanilyticus TaxID=126569 RepID=A0ABQ6NI00_9BACL|nr:hypothetical protein [Paenibacillus glycanilyticus]GMK44746.1 hypothetical protein PghCCS26_18740 [Paenibacillus glycanilyticus]
MKKMIMIMNVLFFVYGLQTGYAHPQMKTAENLIQKIQFSSSYIKELDSNNDHVGLHNAELWAPDTKFSQDLMLKIDGKIVLRGIYWNSRIMVGDVDDDRLPEVFLYEYSVGSSGAMRLSVFSMIENQWTRIFGDPETFTNEVQRFSSKFLGKNQIGFFDNATRLSGKLDMSNSHFTEEQLKSMVFQTDPISEYIVHYENIGCQIDTVSWVFAFSHPNAVFTVHDFYRFDFQKKVFKLYETKIQNKDVTLAKMSY